MSTYFDLSSNSLCGYLPTELANLPLDFDHKQNSNNVNSISTQCLSGSNADDDGYNTTQTMGTVITMWVVGGAAFTIIVLGVLAGYTTCVKRRTSNDDDIESMADSSTISAPLLNNSNMDLESNGSMGSGVHGEAAACSWWCLTASYE